MIAVYAPGGGAGHTTRARRLVELLGIDDAVILATPSDRRAAGSVPLVEVPRDLDGLPAWLAATVRERGIERLIVDTFPAGLCGEVLGLDIPLDFIARLLRVDEYRRAVPHPWPRFETCYEVEETEVRVECARTRDITVIPSASEGPQPHHGDLRSLAALGMTGAGGMAPFWLIVHSGPAEEVRELIAHTQELQRLEGSETEVLVATPLDLPMPPHFRRIDLFPASALFPAATRIISAGGFNVMQETRPWAEKHEVVPFPRRFDDQFTRAARRRAHALPLRA
jgi:hypothetical protein